MTTSTPNEHLVKLLAFSKNPDSPLAQCRLCQRNIVDCDCDLARPDELTEDGIRLRRQVRQRKEAQA